MMILTILFLAFIQNVSFTMVSRARNRDNMYYHAICSVFSNGTWLATMGVLVVQLIDYSNYWTRRIIFGRFFVK